MTETRVELTNHIRQLKDTITEDTKIALRINQLETERKRILDEAAKENSWIQAADAELETLRQQRLESTQQIKSLEPKVKYYGRDYEEFNPDGLKHDFGGALQVARGQKAVFDAERAVEWLLKSVDELPRWSDVMRLLTPNKREFEKLAKKYGPDFGVSPLSEAIRWEDNVTVRLIKSKLENLQFEDDDMVDEAIERLAEKESQRVEEWTDTKQEQDVIDGLGEWW